MDLSHGDGDVSGQLVQRLASSMETCWTALTESSPSREAFWLGIGGTESLSLASAGQSPCLRPRRPRGLQSDVDEPLVGDRRSLQNTQVAKEHKGGLIWWAEPGGGEGQRETCQRGQRQQHLTADECFSHPLRSRLTGAFLRGRTPAGTCPQPPEGGGHSHYLC